jgi:hypothetical protein
MHGRGALPPDVGLGQGAALLGLGGADPVQHPVTLLPGTGDTVGRLSQQPLQPGE